ncbi:hypothetical protein C4X99_13010 [Leptospira interrogans serovar Geyaweera]|nr:hypothetical protein C5473_09500 [Leptospira interrogans serovar Weerasinghe]KAA1291171.1 hypothetical protein C4X99_13010 [Leptospira interrogans serovar Geyaweera]
MKCRETQQNALSNSVSQALDRSCSKLKLKTKYCITLLLCNLLTAAESAVRQSRIRSNFLTLNLH